MGGTRTRSPAVDTATRSLDLVGRPIPVIGPSLRDPRLHVAAIIVTIHVLGQVVLDFGVSVPHIVAAIGTCFLIEGTWTLVKTGSLVWPASAMLTGSGVALILRVPGIEPHDHWTFDRWYLYAGVAAVSLSTKFAIRFENRHVFNPSNLGLVATFLVLGSERVEPLDFWWAPFGLWMFLAYALIVGGGAAIARRLGTLALAVGFWAALAAGLGVLSASDHCMTSPWTLQPVCGLHFWWVVVTSPETMVFIFFMINDPRTIPDRPRDRVLFGVTVGALAALLMAPQSTEFATKLALLGALTIGSVGRWVARRFTLEAAVVFFHDRDPQVRVLRVLGGVVAALAVSLAIVIAGSSAQGTGEIAISRLPDATGVLPAIDPASLPAVTVDPLAVSFDADMAGPGAQELAAQLAWILEIEHKAIDDADPELIRAVDHGARRDQLLALLSGADTSQTSPAMPLPHRIFDSLHLTVKRSGSQGGVRLVFEGSGRFLDRDLRPGSRFTDVFVLLGASDDRWFLVEVAAPGALDLTDP